MRRLTRHITIHNAGSVIAHGGGDTCDGMEWIHGGLGLGGMVLMVLVGLGLVAAVISLAMKLVRRVPRP